MRSLLAAGALLVGVLPAATAAASWTQGATGRAAATTGVLAAPSATRADVLGEDVVVSWTPARDGTPHEVRRGDGTIVCRDVLADCTDRPGPGTHAWEVRAVAGSAWRSVAAATSATVAPPPDPEPEPTPPPVEAGVAVVLTDASTAAGGGQWLPAVNLEVRDAAGTPVAGATATLDWATDGQDRSVVTGTASCTTDATGRCTAVAEAVNHRTHWARFTLTALVAADGSPLDPGAPAPTLDARQP